MNGLLRILRSNSYLLLAVFIFSNCNNSSDKSNSASGKQGDTISNFHADTMVSAKKNERILDTVIIKDMKFIPAEIKVHKGDMVVWFNQDMVAHCVTEVKQKMWTSASIAAGDSWGMKVDKSSEYYCAIHQVMKGKITVVE